MSALLKKYREEVRGKLQEKFQYKNPMMIPRLVKVIVHMGIAEITKEKNAIQDATKELSLITGQKPYLSRARKSISNFKLREGQPLGLKVTLRGARMYDFIYRFYNIVCPRIRDFRGFPTKGDGRGNYSLGLADQQIFPEINLDEVKRNQGMHITFVTSAQSDQECYELLMLLGCPFSKPKLK